MMKLALALVAAAAMALLTVAPAQAATCNLRGKEQRLGPTYVTKLSVTRTSCANGVALARAYYRCRVAAGGRKGRCRKPVRGMRCSERRFNQIATQFDATVSCRSGSRRVNHRYTQYT